MKPLKFIFFSIIVLIFIFSAYYLGFNNGRTKEIISKRKEISQLQSKLTDKVKGVDTNPEVKEEKIPEDQTSDASSGPETKATDQGDYLEYEVQDKDTLFTIGLKFDLTWEKIAQANNFEEDTALYIGQKIKIPKLVEGNNEDQLIPVEINLDEAKNQQQALNQSSADLWRLDPIEVIRKEAPSGYDFLPGDAYSLLSKDVNKGEARVFLQKPTKSFTFNLIQPADKGDKGIWKINEISFKNNE